MDDIWIAVQNVENPLMLLAFIIAVIATAYYYKDYKKLKAKAELIKVLPEKYRGKCA